MQLVLFLSTMLFAATARAGTVSIYVNAAPKDYLGQQLVYDLKQDVIASAEFHLIYSQSQALYSISIVTISDAQHDGTEYSTAYSAVLIAKPDVFVDNQVGICGADRIQSCAANIISGLGGDIDTLR